MRRSWPVSVGEIQSGVYKGRKSTYKGIEFRSKLEVKFAWWLDDMGEQWRYEPRIYGPKGRGYLPDFEILGTDRPTFIEIKPTLALAERAKSKVSVIWEYEPRAVIVIATREHRTFFIGERGVWDSWQERWPA